MEYRVKIGSYGRLTGFFSVILLRSEVLGSGPGIWSWDLVLELVLGAGPDWLQTGLKTGP